MFEVFGSFLLFLLFLLFLVFLFVVVVVVVVVVSVPKLLSSHCYQACQTMVTLRPAFDAQD
jgi:hypothetical protein